MPVEMIVDRPRPDVRPIELQDGLRLRLDRRPANGQRPSSPPGNSLQSRSRCMLVPGTTRTCTANMPVRSRRVAATILVHQLRYCCALSCRISLVRASRTVRARRRDASTRTSRRRIAPSGVSKRAWSAPTKHGWMEAWTEFHPGQRIDRRGGARRRVRIHPQPGPAQPAHQRAGPAGERQAAARSRSKRRTTPSKMAARPTTGLRRIILKPARKSDGIVNGSLFIEPERRRSWRMKAGW